MHVNDDRGVDIALGLGAHAVTHLVLDGPSREQLERVRRAGMHVITTLYTVGLPTMRHQPSLLDAPMVRLTVPTVERETARDQAAWDV